MEYINYVFVFCHVLEYIIMCSCSVIFRPDGIPDAILYVLFHVLRPLLEKEEGGATNIANNNYDTNFFSPRRRYKHE